MSQTYINIGETCTAFTETKPTDLANNVYLINTSSKSILRNSDYTEVGPDSITGNVAIFNDYEFKTWFDESLIRSSANRSFWRYLTPSDATAKPMNDFTKTVNTNTSWPTNMLENDVVQVNYPAGSSKTYKMVIQTHPDLSPIISGLIAFPPGITETTQFYLRKTGSTTVYYHNGVQKDLSVELFDTSKLSTFSMTKELRETPSKRFVLTIKDNPSFRVDSNYRIFVNGNFYDIVTVRPSSVIDPTFPQTVTMLKSVTGKYLYWNKDNSIFSLKGYWDAGLSFDNIMTGLQFYFRDLTFGVNAPANPTSPIAVDYYRWMVRLDSTIAPEVSGNTANVVVVTNTISVDSLSSTKPTDNEGWVLSGSQAPYHLIYIRADNSGNFNTIGYANIVENTDNVIFVSGSTLPNHSKSWFCNKCTPNATSGICNTN